MWPDLSARLEAGFDGAEQLPANPRLGRFESSYTPELPDVSDGDLPSFVENSDSASAISH